MHEFGCAINMREFASQAGAPMNDNSQNQPFEMVARELIPVLSRYLRHYTSDRSVADDLLQETLVRVSHGLRNFEGRSNIRTWAFAIATRVAADYFRQPAHRVKIVDILSMEDSEELAIDETAIDEKLANGAMAACIREVVDSLPEDYRAALVLHDLEEMAARQVAEICGIPVSTVKIRIHRARKRLREALTAQCEFYRDDGNVFRCYRKAAPQLRRPPPLAEEVVMMAESGSVGTAQSAARVCPLRQ